MYTKMLVQSRSGGVTARWKQLSKLGKFTVLTTFVFFILAILWGTGTVDVEYVRNRLSPIAHDDPSNEPIPQEDNDTPIIDGVPNAKNDKPLPDGIIEEPDQPTRAAVVDEVLNTVVNADTKTPKPDLATSSSMVPGTAQSEPASTSAAVLQPTTSSIKSAASSKSMTSSVKTIVVESPFIEVPAAKTTAEASPTHGGALGIPGSTSDTAPTPTASSHKKPIAGGIPLRIMFIGASVTLGTPPQSAYRQQLREWLVGLGNHVNLVGSARFGEFRDNDVQAFASSPIKHLIEESREAIPEMKPNLVIINAGSSDCFQEKNFGSAHGLDDTRALVDLVFDSVPGTTVILSTLVMSTDPKYERCIKSINAQIRQVAIDLQRDGKHIVLNEQHDNQGLPDRVTAETLSSDQMHPTYEGWVMMGELFKESILEVDAKGWLKAPAANGIMDDGDAERDLEEAWERMQEEKKKIEEAKATHERRGAKVAPPQLKGQPAKFGRIAARDFRKHQARGARE
ncbi:hypothetical protein F5Y18DRAFT_390095 [Xylariaceae sp. FL1019]|nr:hypothetical protein F5Y18DRAFT_390095 [Xylariaceae sp. FL1019]